MRLIYGNLLDPSTYRYPGAVDVTVGIKPSAIVITTNGFVKRTGDAVMGRGCAKGAADRWPQLPLLLGQSLKKHGNCVQLINTIADLRIVSFPVKPSSQECMPDKSNVVQHMQHRMTPGKMVPGWACVADMRIITRSAKQLVVLAEKKGWASVVLPRPGCGCGELDWQNVRPVLERILGDSFYCITFNNRA